MSQKENEENVKFLMDSMINPEVDSITENGILFPKGLLNAIFLRTMIDGKMSGILNGAAGAHCQLCTANKSELKDIEIMRSGFPINRSISSAKDIFSIVDEEEYLAFPSPQRHGLTHQPLSSIDIIPASSLHTYLCVFHWYMLLI